VDRAGRRKSRSSAALIPECQDQMVKTRSEEETGEGASMLRF
jgi:hypothetical protein